MEKIASGKALLKPYEIYSLCGTVEAVESDSVTEVSGSISGGGGGGVHMGGYRAPVRGDVSSETTTFQTIFLKEESGKETVIKFKNKTIPCREGHKLSFFAMNDNNEVNGYFKIVNHNTHEVYENNGIINDYMFPWFIILGASAALWTPFVLEDYFSGEHGAGIILLTFVIMMVLSVAVLFIPGKIFAKVRAVAATKNADFKKYMDGLKS